MTLKKGNTLPPAMKHKYKLYNEAVMKLHAEKDLRELPYFIDSWNALNESYKKESLAKRGFWTRFRNAFLNSGASSSTDFKHVLYELRHRFPFLTKKTVMVNSSDSVLSDNRSKKPDPEFYNLIKEEAALEVGLLYTGEALTNHKEHLNDLCKFLERQMLLIDELILTRNKVSQLLVNKVQDVNYKRAVSSYDMLCRRLFNCSSRFIDVLEPTIFSGSLNYARRMSAFADRVEALRALNQKEMDGLKSQLKTCVKINVRNLDNILPMEKYQVYGGTVKLRPDSYAILKAYQDYIPSNIKDYPSYSILFKHFDTVPNHRSFHSALFALNMQLKSVLRCLRAVGYDVPHVQDLSVAEKRLHRTYCMVPLDNDLLTNLA